MNADSVAEASQQAPPGNVPPQDGVQGAAAPEPGPKRRTLQSGFSLLARGEPKIWFTGGMLVICLFMIFGLMGLILYAGLPSFWPLPVDLLALNDGTLEIGQSQKTEKSQLEDSSAGGVRRYFRTGNFDVTQSHYRWLESSDLGASGVGRPQWAMVVERLEWGRLYGIPIRLDKKIRLDPQTQEEISKVDRLLKLLETLSSEDAAWISELTIRLEEAQAVMRDRFFRARLVELQDLESTTLQCRLGPADDWISLADLQSDSRIHELRVSWNENETLATAMQDNIATATQLRRKREQLKDEISRLDSGLAELRVAIRRAELEVQNLVAVQVEQAHYLLEQQGATTQQKKQLSEHLELIDGLVADDSTQPEFSKLLSEFGEEKLQAETERLAAEVQQWVAPTEDQPVPIQSAVQAYLNGYRETFALKRPIEYELAQIEAALASAEIRFAIPNGLVPVPDVDGRDLEQLRAGILTETLQSKLNEQSIAVDNSVAPLVESLAERLSLVTMVDVGGTRHLLALQQNSYLSPEGGELESPDTAEWQVGVLPMQPVVFESVVRAVEVNRLDLFDKLGVYVERWKEFLWENPREANTEGGVFPAIWGTVVMTLIMTIAVVPFGVMAALYLREYTKSGPLVSLIRISINNLAGVPSIVYGVFGFSFFCYTIGAFIDGGAKNADIEPWPSGSWFLILGGLAILGTAAFFFSFLSGGPTHSQTRAKRLMARTALVLWLTSVAVMAMLVLKSPFFSGFFPEYLPTPTYGKGGLLWASLTLALLTLPVVIVATEEALSAVPNSLREGSLACGASKWQTIRRIILPHARPGIMTGAILAMARGAGEVAPLMLVGALPTAPDLPLDGEFPFFHGSRSFQHLGYQIYTLGFQSQNSEAAKPMVFTCTLLLILIVAALNVSAIYLRARLKRRFQGNQF